MIQPDALLDVARSLAADGSGQPSSEALRRAISTAYYAVFHDLTDQAARHLIGSAPDQARNRVRRTWTHGEVVAAAEMIVDRAGTIAAAPNAPLKKEAEAGGPLVDLAAADADLVEALRLFASSQERRHRADYDHDARFDMPLLLTACRDAQDARDRLATASASSREALFAC